ncbi:MAG: L-threonylcarbamoyladenylate synthase [Candidatus Peregrinibacteria bacterium]|nr:L-threonylcarbamoyladenylate synthase [Candidatus Peregrinibacteria bacterium]MDZ4209697.1 L-threonylcarbamoyladenylate synthase [Candidatus Curtissbacteria bacterium]
MNDFEKALEILQANGVILHPTETCYGLACDVFSESALAKIYAIKGRDKGKPLAILVSDIEMAKEYGVFGDRALGLASRFWPGALSIVVPRTEKLPIFLNSGEKFVSMRVSSDKFSTDLVKALGRPIVTTSANLAGESVMYEVDMRKFEVEISGGDSGEVSRRVMAKDLIDFVVDGGKIPLNKPSTVVKIEGDRVTVLRQGEIFI